MASKPVVGVCATCGCPAKQWCSKCNSIYFCGKDCQRQAWPEHKKLCAALQEEYLKTHPPKKQQEGTKQPQQKPQKRQQDVNLRSKWWRLRAGAYRTKEELLQLMEPFDLPEGLSEHEENARIKRMFGLCDIQETLKFYPPQGDNWYHYGLADPTNRSGPVNQVASRTTHRNLARPIHGDVFIVKSGPTWTGHFPGSWEAEPLLKKGDLADAIMWYETQDGHQTFVQREHSRACRRFGVNVPPDVFTVLA